jgi:hypothetical protein
VRDAVGGMPSLLGLEVLAEEVDRALDVREQEPEGRGRKAGHLIWALQIFMRPTLLRTKKYGP